MTKDQEAQALFQEIAAKQERLVELLRCDPPEAVIDHAFASKDGEVRLSELFGAHDDLIVVHNMGSACPYCTLWADGFAGVLSHLESRAAFAVVSPDDPDTQARFAATRRWPFRMVSDRDRRFTRGMGFLTEQGGRARYLPGFSTLRRDPHGTITRVGRSFFGPGDPYAGIWHLFAMLHGGAGDWQPRFAYP